MFDEWERWRQGHLLCYRGNENSRAQQDRPRNSPQAICIFFISKDGTMDSEENERMGNNEDEVLGRFAVMTVLFYSREDDILLRNLRWSPMYGIVDSCSREAPVRSSTLRFAKRQCFGICSCGNHLLSVSQLALGLSNCLEFLSLR